MKNSTNFFINGEWVKPKSESKFEVINPASEEVVCHITLGNQLDLDSAVYAAKQGFLIYSNYSREDKLMMFERIISFYKKRMNDLSNAITLEMGAPKTLSEKAQTPSGLGHFIQAKKILENFNFEKEVNSSIVKKEAKVFAG